uniref:DUF4794 domain-containing protein n=1 Tax=Megaselia scalaris TaxID=36166 RepID=T1H336_MEGSC
MKLFVFALAFTAAFAVQSPITEYLPPVASASAPSQEYLPPVSAAASEPGPVVLEAPRPLPDNVGAASVSQGQLAADGYRYKTVRKLKKYRHRRDVSELNRDYLPPFAASEQVSVSAPAPAPVSFAAPEPVAAPAPVADFETSASVPQGSLAADGYRYKTVRRLRYRHRRDVSELNRDYLPPVAASEQVSVSAPAPAPVDPIAILLISNLKCSMGKENVYLQKVCTQSKLSLTCINIGKLYLSNHSIINLFYIHSLFRAMKLFVFGFAILALTAAAVIPQNEYIPPSDEVVEPSNEYLAPAEEAVAEDGYRYKTVKKLKYRNKRDVSEVANEYLPPSEETQVEEEESQDTAVLADDGYQYKTVRRLKYRNRRDVSEIEPANEYLPPTKEAVPVETVEEPEQDSAVLADDGYQYKTVRRLKYRQRRDVSEVVAPEYLHQLKKLLQLKPLKNQNKTQL